MLLGGMSSSRSPRPLPRIRTTPRRQTMARAVEVCRLLDILIPSRLAEQLVEVPTPSPALVAPRMEDQLVEVPPIVPHVVPQSFLAGADGHCWAQISGRTGVYWLRVGTSHTQCALSEFSASPGRKRNTGPGGLWTSLRSCSSCSSSPSRTCSCRDSVPSTESRTFQLCHRREIPQCSP